MSSKIDPSRGMESLGREYGFSPEMMRNFKIPGFTSTTVFYRPDDEQLTWLIDYANGRPIFDIGCGSGWLLRQLALKKYPGLAGIEPHWDAEEQRRWHVRMCEKGLNPTFFNVLDMYTTELLFQQMLTVDRPFLFLLCRPSHGNWPGLIAEQLSLNNSPSELLLVQKEDTFYRTRDLKPYDRNMRLVPHQGSSEDGEKFYSFISACNFPAEGRPGDDLFSTLHPFD